MNIAKRFIKHINNEIHEYGLMTAARRFLGKGDVIVESINLSNKVEHLLKNKPVLIVANHPYELESLALLAILPERKDARLVVNSHFCGIFPDADKYLIPAYIDHHSNHGPETWIFTLLGHLFSRQKGMSVADAHTKNVQSIQQASEIINKAGQVIIFPERRGKNRAWYNGVGHLIHGITNPREAYLVRAYITGSGKWDIVRVIPVLRKLFPKLSVYFAPPVRISTCMKETPQSTTLNLEREYLLYFKRVHTYDN